MIYTSLVKKLQEEILRGDYFIGQTFERKELLVVKKYKKLERGRLVRQRERSESPYAPYNVNDTSKRRLTTSLRLLADEPSALRLINSFVAECLRLRGKIRVLPSLYNNAVRLAADRREKRDLDARRSGRSAFRFSPFQTLCRVFL